MSQLTRRDVLAASAGGAATLLSAGVSPAAVAVNDQIQASTTLAQDAA